MSRKSAVVYKFGKSSFFDKNGLHVADAILHCIDEYLSRFGLFRRHVLCATLLGISVHDTLATKDPTLRTAKAVPGLQNVEVSITKSRTHENQRFRSEGLQKLGLFWIFTLQ